jgi:hypothetical protein
MNTDSTSPDSKARRKVCSGAANDKVAYDQTEFGRRRTSRMPKWLAALIRLVGVPVLFIYRRLRRSRGA